MFDWLQPDGPNGKSDPERRRVLHEMITFSVLGFLIGIVFALFIGTLLWSFGIISLGPSSCPDAKSLCPPTAEALPVCPTCAVQFVTPTYTPTPAPTATPSPDMAATATAACSAFEAQFPGTPCPPLEPTATPAP